MITKNIIKTFDKDGFNIDFRGYTNNNSTILDLVSHYKIITDDFYIKWYIDGLIHVFKSIDEEYCFSIYYKEPNLSDIENYNKIDAENLFKKLKVIVLFG